jgi:hypothetical protein
VNSFLAKRQPMSHDACRALSKKTRKESDYEETVLSKPSATRRGAIKRLGLWAGLTAVAASAAASPVRAQGAAAAAPAPHYGRRRVRGLSDVLFVVGGIAAIFGWAFWSGSRDRKKARAKQELEERLARCREKSRAL